MIEMTLQNGLKIYSGYAYVVVESSSGGGGGGTIIIPSGDSGQITNNSGDLTGNIDLTGVQNRLDGVNQNLGVINDNITTQGNNIVNAIISGDKLIADTISGEVSKILDSNVSGELFQPEIELENPTENFYQNFYQNLITSFNTTSEEFLTVYLPR